MTLIKVSSSLEDESVVIAEMGRRRKLPLTLAGLGPKIESPELDWTEEVVLDVEIGLELCCSSEDDISP
jgi:hypothetical protein